MFRLNKRLKPLPKSALFTAGKDTSSKGKCWLDKFRGLVNFQVAPRDLTSGVEDGLEGVVFEGEGEEGLPEGEVFEEDVSSQNTGSGWKKGEQARRRSKRRRLLKVNPLVACGMIVDIIVVGDVTKDFSGK